MTPRIDFYILSTDQRPELYTFLCRLLEKIYTEKHKAYVYMQDTQSVHQLDELLWTYRDDSFIPHNILGEGPEKPPAIQLGATQPPNHHRDILINLTPSVPDFFIRFSRVIECVISEPSWQEQARERFKHYRQAGCTPQSHKIP